VSGCSTWCGDVIGELVTGERRRQAVENARIPHSASTTGAYVTLSIGGVATIPQNSQSLLEALISADLP
jgi:hypothetical protein